MTQKSSRSEPLYIEALEDGVYFSASFTIGTLSYSIDGGEYLPINSGEQSLYISNGSKIHIKGNAFYRTTSPRFTIKGKSKLGGKLFSVSYGDNYNAILSVAQLFCQNMFSHCDIVAVEKDFLNYELGGSSCYSAMFRGCLYLTDAPELPATTLTMNCYGYMFYGCTSLTTAPSLPATTLAASCYSYMFYNCSKLNYIDAAFTTPPSTTYTGYWVYGVSPTGTFVKNPEATWDVVGVDGVPSGWTIQKV